MTYYIVVYATINRSAQVEYNYYHADCGFIPPRLAPAIPYQGEDAHGALRIT